MPDCLIHTVSVDTGTAFLLQLAAVDQLPLVVLIHAFTLSGATTLNAVLVPEVNPVALALSV